MGNLVVFLGVAMGTGWHRVQVGTSEPISARTKCCSLGRIASRYQ